MSALTNGKCFHCGWTQHACTNVRSKGAAACCRSCNHQPTEIEVLRAEVRELRNEVRELRAREGADR